MSQDENLPFDDGCGRLIKLQPDEKYTCLYEITQKRQPTTGYLNSEQYACFPPGTAIF